MIVIAALVAAVAAAAGFFWLLGDPPAGPLRNVVLISVDTLRADHLGIHGYRRPTSPHIDRLGRAGVTFLRAVAQSPATLPSHASIFTSRYPSQHRTIKEGLSYTELQDSELTLAEILKKRGYRTAAFTGGGETARVFSLDQGFDLYDDQGGGLARINRRVFAWLSARGKAPFFLFVHCYDTHEPYEPPPPFDALFPEQALKVDLKIKDPTPADEARFLRKTMADYAAEIAYTDQHVGALLERLKKLGLGSDTLVIFTSDHGEEFLEHRKLGHSEHIYDESIHVPLIFHGPGVRPRMVRQQVSSVDIAPTVLGLLGVAAPARMMGVSLQPLMAGEAALERPAYSENERRLQYSVRTSTHKLIADTEKKTFQLYDLIKDPGEQRDLAAGRPPEYTRLRRLIEDWRRRVDRTAGHRHPTRSLSDDRKKNQRLFKQLRSLGYIE